MKRKQPIPAYKARLQMRKQRLIARALVDTELAHRIAVLNVQIASAGSGSASHEAPWLNVQQDPIWAWPK